MRLDEIKSDKIGSDEIRQDQMRSIFKVVLHLLRITVYINIVENTIYIPSIEAFGFPQPAHRPCLSLILHRIPGDGLTGARLVDLNAVQLRYMLYHNREPFLMEKL